MVLEGRCNEAADHLSYLTVTRWAWRDTGRQAGCVLCSEWQGEVCRVQYLIIIYMNSMLVWYSCIAATFLLFVLAAGAAGYEKHPGKHRQQRHQHQRLLSVLYNLVLDRPTNLL